MTGISVRTPVSAVDRSRSDAEWSEAFLHTVQQDAVRALARPDGHQCDRGLVVAVVRAVDPGRHAGEDVDPDRVALLAVQGDHAAVRVGFGWN